MSSRGVTIPLLVGLLALVAGCGDSNHHLFRDEIAFLQEDVIDLMTVVFQAGENAFVGDPVLPQDVIDPAGAGNNFTVTYDLPAALRLNLGFGAGRALLQVFEDGVVNPAPLAFSFSTTAASSVSLTYELRYQREAAGGRPSDVDLIVSVDAARAPGGGWDVDYFIEGDVDFGVTFTSLQTDFSAAGRPRDGIVPGVGDGAGFIDDPDVFDVFHLDLDYFVDDFRAAGDVGFDAFFEDFFFYSEVL